MALSLSTDDGEMLNSCVTQVVKQHVCGPHFLARGKTLDRLRRVMIDRNVISNFHTSTADMQLGGPDDVHSVGKMIDTGTCRW